MKKRTDKEEISALAEEIIQEMVHWTKLKEYGGSDPLWPDGCNMNLTRNHILGAKNQIREICERTGLPYPEQYAMETPPEVPNDYMARKEEIRFHAKTSLVFYQNDIDYRYLRKQKDNLSDQQKKDTHIDAVLGYVDGLISFIETDDFIGMRRHEYPNRYADSFRECAKKVKKILESKLPETRELPLGQLSIFDLYAF